MTDRTNLALPVDVVRLFDSTVSQAQIDADTFQEHAQAAKDGCPVSKALAGVEITLDATLA